MKHSVLGGLTVAVAMSVFGAPLPSHAQDSNSGLSLDPEAEHHAEALSLTDYPDAGQPADSDPSTFEPAEPAEPESALLIQPSDEASQTLDTATVFPHALDARQAATVYIRSIPVITLIGGELETLSAGNGAVATPPDAQEPLRQASGIVARLQTLAADGDANAIEARWEDESEAFVVAWGDETLLTVNDKVILPDTTANPGEDALQMANRLRRLLGDAPPLARVEGLPEPAVEVNRVGVVASSLTGMASWYGPGFHGRRSASGEVFDQNALTAAHRTLPFGTQVRVTNLSTGQSVVVRINDRGPFGHGRVIDLSAAAAGQIGLRASGVGRVQVDVLSTQ
ncbi:septal ring lytic transglycosylase RlpA family protein [Nodosilinea sp. LEGE 07298]|jgi:rare lipoprotein A|uniref:septal ring lytic transglycosylase RlpA family protein n=1 Tax=Nodosilinea sp. LEGE 07298 TaxID=2777970 RepID=UPI00187EE6D7|nr:septal ring lytic transglycosylase RlpA family protein [Nodosilinea sp. LEGE 07298]MBE9108878.1 septal ring lytic transglycosylase RlpA family protein [Nodosilinea sp. LEGE 07298]